ncbi:MAG: LysR family transcriptional regulator [Desulfobacteraceae bacterium]|nr:LysR family transcriptional regulator [Desulfobacteraceae bacterium]
MKKHGRKRTAAGAGSQTRWQGRLWLEGPEGTFLGYGRVVLLERIQEHGSLAGAARSMEMSYKHAWDLLASMTRQAGCPLVATARGGKGGGGAALTPAGEKAVALFWRYHARFQEVLAGMAAEMGELLCDEHRGENQG